MRSGLAVWDGLGSDIQDLIVKNEIYVNFFMDNEKPRQGGDGGLRAHRDKSVLNPGLSDPSPPSHHSLSPLLPYSYNGEGHTSRFQAITLDGQHSDTRARTR